MSVAKKDYKRITTKTLIEMKENGEKISMLTSYDFTMAKIVDSAGVDVILVGVAFKVLYIIWTPKDALPPFLFVPI